jgi:ribonuclease VapC
VILETSVLIAILKRETDARAFLTEIDASDASRLSAASYLETAIVVDGNRDPVLGRELDELLRETAIAIEPVTEAQARIARDAYRDFGKGSGHPAQLNVGDCFAYALAKAMGEPLLFKGDDFRHTDVTPAQDQGAPRDSA